jgi:hypothetical protein
MLFSLLSVAVVTTSGGLLAERTPVAGMLLGRNLEIAAAGLEGMSKTELDAERVRVMEAMPSPALGITLTAVGGGVLLTGLVIVGAATTLEVLAVGFVIIAASVPLLIIGPIMLARAIRERRNSETRLRLINQQMRELDNGRGSEQPTNTDTPPPPPVRPPDVFLIPTALPQVLVATF